MEENSKKKCPFCDAEINLNAKKCRFCNNWIDDEVECPFCAEKIKASAKKCRYCGEWLADNQKNVEGGISSSQKLQINKSLFIWIGVALVILILFVGLLGVNLYVPKCQSDIITKNLKEYLAVQYPNMGYINIFKGDIATIKKNDKGYTCSAAATIDSVPTHIEYSYQKVSMNDFNYDAKIVLPNCYDNQVKQLLANIVKDVEYYNIKNIASDVTTSYETEEKFDKESQVYYCTAETSISAKPGRAFKLNFWNNDSATRKIKCRVDYKSYFCENGFTTCVAVKDIYSCEDKRD